jgi:hypothetical protein
MKSVISFFVYRFHFLKLIILNFKLLFLNKFKGILRRRKNAKVSNLIRIVI